MREPVRARIQELNYRTNLMARALVTGRTYTIGLVVPDLVHPFFGKVAAGLSKVIGKKGCSLIISSSEEEANLWIPQGLAIVGTGNARYAKFLRVPLSTVD